MSVTAIILAAGKGTRMKSRLPKVLHQVCGQPMLAHVLQACRSAGCDKLICVIGYGADEVREAFAGQKDIVWVEQTEQLGTGHAVMACAEVLAGLTGPVLILGGDGPLVRSQTLKELLAAHANNTAACTLATAVLEDPAAYGRIIRDARGELTGIVEFLDATDAQRKIKEVNVSLYCFDVGPLREVLGALDSHNAKGEYYLTDTLALLRQAGHTLAAVPNVWPAEVLSINDRVQLAEVNQVFQQRIQQSHMLAGVTIDQPATTWIDSRATIGSDTVIRPCTVIDGACRIGAGCTIGPFVHLRDANVPDETTLEHTHG